MQINGPPIKSISNLTNKVCPFIGTRDDRSTYFSYPSPGNHCFRVDPNQSIALSHQENFCLEKNFETCPVNSSSWKGPLPLEIRSASHPNEFFTNSRWIIIIFSILFLLFSFIIYVLNIQNLTPFRTGLTNTASPTLYQSSDTPVRTAVKSSSGENQVFTNITETPVGFTPTAAPTENPPEPSQTGTNSPIPTITNTPTLIFPTVGPLLETPFGPENRFVIHAVQEGEFLGRIADNYDTSVDLIIAANDFIEGANLWVGTLLVILTGEVDVNDIPKFQIIFVESSTTIDNLAQEYSILKDELIYYNSLGPLEEIPAGRWIILPITFK